MPLKIGLVTTSLITLPAPTVQGDIVLNYNDNKQVSKTLNNQIFIRQTGIFRRSFDVTWDFKTKAEYDILMQYLNIPMQFYVELTDTTTVWYGFFSYLSLKTQSIQANTRDTFRAKVSATIDQVF